MKANLERKLQEQLQRPHRVSRALVEELLQFELCPCLPVISRRSSQAAQIEKGAEDLKRRMEAAGSPKACGYCWLALRQEQLDVERRGAPRSQTTDLAPVMWWRGKSCIVHWQLAELEFLRRGGRAQDADRCVAGLFDCHRNQRSWLALPMLRLSRRYTLK